MTWLQALALAIIQGLTEFLPVSSSGHLALSGRLFGLPAPDIAYDVLIHLATLVAVMLYYRKTLWNLAVGLFRPVEQTGFAARPWRFLLFIILSTLPTGVIGLGLDAHMETLHDNLLIVGVCFLVTGALLLLTFGALRKSGNLKDLLDMPYWVPVVIGIAQGVAVMPGISRSGMTIGVAILLGICGQQATRYGFLVSIPAILGAFVLKLPEMTGSGFGMVHVAGFLVALMVGLLAIRVVEKVVENNRLHHFAIYMGAVALITFLVEALT